MASVRGCLAEIAACGMPPFAFAAHALACDPCPSPFGAQIESKDVVMGSSNHAIEMTMVWSVDWDHPRVPAWSAGRNKGKGRLGLPNCVRRVRRPSVPDDGGRPVCMQSTISRTIRPSIWGHRSVVWSSLFLGAFPGPGVVRMSSPSSSELRGHWLSRLELALEVGGSLERQRANGPLQTAHACLPCAQRGDGRGRGL